VPPQVGPPSRIVIRTERIATRRRAIENSVGDVDQRRLDTAAADRAGQIVAVSKPQNIAPASRGEGPSVSTSVERTTRLPSANQARTRSLTSFILPTSIDRRPLPVASGRRKPRQKPGNALRCPPTRPSGFSAPARPDGHNGVAHGRSSRFRPDTRAARCKVRPALAPRPDAAAINRRLRRLRGTASCWRSFSVSRRPRSSTSLSKLKRTGLIRADAGRRSRHQLPRAARHLARELAPSRTARSAAHGRAADRKRRLVRHRAAGRTVRISRAPRRGRRRIRNAPASKRNTRATSKKPPACSRWR